MLFPNALPERSLFFPNALIAFVALIRVQFLPLFRFGDAAIQFGEVIAGLDCQLEEADDPRHREALENRSEIDGEVDHVRPLHS